MKKLIITTAIFATVTSAAECPPTECNYLDPQYTAAIADYTKCTTPIVDQFTHAMEKLAIAYPKFGIAWRAQESDMKAAASDPGNTQLEANTEEAHRRFEDRVLRTAEPEAQLGYNQWMLGVKQATERCGPGPQPPKRQTYGTQSVPQTIWVLIAFHRTATFDRDKTLIFEAYATNRACLDKIEINHSLGNSGLDDPKHWEWNCMRTELKTSAP